MSEYQYYEFLTNDRPEPKMRWQRADAFDTREGMGILRPIYISITFYLVICHFSYGGETLWERWSRLERADNQDEYQAAEDVAAR